MRLTRAGGKKLSFWAYIQSVTKRVRRPKLAIALTRASWSHTVSPSLRHAPPDTLMTPSNPAGWRAASASTAPPPSDWPMAIACEPSASGPRRDCLERGVEILGLDVESADEIAVLARHIGS